MFIELAIAAYIASYGIEEEEYYEEAELECSDQ